jgi:hypothetical protein
LTNSGFLLFLGEINWGIVQRLGQQTLDLLIGVRIPVPQLQLKLDIGSWFMDHSSNQNHFLNYPLLQENYKNFSKKLAINQFNETIKKRSK